MGESQGLFDAAIRVALPLQDLFLATALASLRLLAAFTLLPPLGEQFIQGYVRMGLVVIIAAYVAFGLPVGAASHLSALGWGGYAAKETMIGLVMGFAASTVFWIAESVGALIDTQSEFNSVQMSNPMSGEQSTPVSNLLVQLVVVVFYQLGGMLVFIGAVFESFRVWPLFSAMPDMAKAQDLFVISQMDSLMTGVVKFAAPMLLILVLVDLGFGLVTRSADKLEPSKLSQPVKGAVTMLMLALLMGVLISQVKSQLVPTGLLARIQASLGAHR
jgi:type III secretion protein T